MGIKSHQDCAAEALEEMMEGHRGAVGDSIGKRRAPPPPAAVAQADEPEDGIDEALLAEIAAEIGA